MNIISLPFFDMTGLHAYGVHYEGVVRGERIARLVCLLAHEPVGKPC